MNIHLLEHVVNGVRNYGPLWTHSAFHFEAYNAVLLNFISGTTDILHQISTKYILSHLSNSLCNEQSAETSEAIEFLGRSTIKHENSVELKICKTGQVISLENMDLSIFKRMKRNKTIYTSINYTRAKKNYWLLCAMQGQNNFWFYTILLHSWQWEICSSRPIRISSKNRSHTKD